MKLPIQAPHTYVQTFLQGRYQEQSRAGADKLSLGYIWPTVLSAVGWPEAKTVPPTAPHPPLPQNADKHPSMDASTPGSLVLLCDPDYLYFKFRVL